jgi:tripartite-type tricarboxylate transporter receptor subunit TctC
MSGIGRRQFVKGAGALGMAALAPHAAFAQDWPNRQVRFIVPLAAGGGLDFISRLFGEPISKGIGQQIYIENRTGAGGTIGIDAAIKSPPDGYSILSTNDNVASAPHVLKLSVDFLKDLMPIALLGRQPQVWAVHPSFEVSTMKEMVEAAKKMSSLGCATSGVGSNQHVLMEWFGKTAGIKLEHVPYRGAGQAINDLLAGHVKLACLGPTAVWPHAQAGKLKVLAQSGEKRVGVMPNIPTIQEAGFQGVALESWYALFAPIGTPPAVIQKINAEVNKAIAEKSIQEALFKTATDVGGGTPEQLGKIARDDAEKYKKIVSEVNIKLT